MAPPSIILILSTLEIVVTITFTRISSTKTLVSTSSPFVNVSIRVLSLMYNSTTVSVFTILFETFSTRAVAPDNTPVIFLLANIVLSSVLCKTLILEPVIGAVLKTSFFDSFRT